MTRPRSVWVSFHDAYNPAHPVAVQVDRPGRLNPAYSAVRYDLHKPKPKPRKGKPRG
jgi:hypothetical protein